MSKLLRSLQVQQEEADKMILESMVGAKSKLLLRKAKLESSRKLYHKWRQRTKESKTYIAILFAMCEGVCPECGQSMVLSFNEKYNHQPNAATLDHITPLKDVLTHSKFALQIMCRQCNCQKQSKK